MFRKCIIWPNESTSGDCVPSMFGQAAAIFQNTNSIITAAIFSK